jgi:hypothetical protein
MYEDTIEKILETDSATRNEFMGALARNELPKKIQFPKCFVLNTENRDHPGGHWLGFHFNKRGFCSFFDSYGQHPKKYGLENYHEFSRGWTFNRKRIQSLSSYCGLYCILFLLYKCRNKEDAFFKLFSKNYLKNDKKIQIEIQKNF